MSSIVQTCKECHKAFELDSRTVKWFVEKDLKIPKRCKDCREKIKKQQNRSLKLKDVLQQD